jgi:hypothetical protein
MNAQRPFVDRAMTEVDAADRAAAEAASSWGLVAPVLLRRGMNALYVCDDVVVRVGHATAPAHLAHELVDVMAARGVPTVTPIAGLASGFGGLAVTAWVRVEKCDDVVDWTAVGAAVRRVHEVPLAEIPGGYPVPSPTAFPWWNFDSLLGEVSDLIDGAALAGITAALDRHAGWRDQLSSDPVVCHGDVHPGNVLMSSDGPLLIDWDLLCTADPAWDHAMLTTYAARWGGDQGVYEAFVGGYGRDLATSGLTIAVAELRNVAATLMRVRAGREIPAARAEAERRLRYWRGDPAAPMWTAQ